MEAQQPAIQFLAECDRAYTTVFRLSVTLCTVAKRRVLEQNSAKVTIDSL